MKKFVVFGLCLVLLLGAVQAFGQGLTGKNEISGAGAWIRASADGEDLTATLIGAAYGKYINENLQAKVDFIYASGDIDDDDLSAWIIAPALVWNFTPKTPSAIVPYVGVGLAYASIDTPGDSDNSFAVEYFGGAKFFIGGNYDCANKNVFVEFRHTSIDLFGEDATLNMLWTGISTLF